MFLFPSFAAESVPQSTSEFLKNISVQFEELNLVKVECFFKNGIEDASCVLVYREYRNKTLVVKEYSQNSMFPMNVTVDGTTNNYTFALFGKNGSVMDERPFSALLAVEIPTEKNAPNQPVGLIAGTLIV